VNYLNNCAVWFYDQQRFAEAEPLLRETLEARRKTAEDNPSALSMTAVRLGHVLVEIGKPAEAEPLLRESLEMRRSTLPADHWLIANVQSLLGAALAGQSRFDEAEPLLLEGYAGMKDHPQAPAQRKAEALQRIVTLYEASGQSERAAEWRALLEQSDSIVDR
jgi:tetratricopeptide (TPR) repeat protein